MLNVEGSRQRTSVVVDVPAPAMHVALDIDAVGSRQHVCSGAQGDTRVDERRRAVGGGGVITRRPSWRAALATAHLHTASGTL